MTMIEPPPASTRFEANASTRSEKKEAATENPWLRAAVAIGALVSPTPTDR